MINNESNSEKNQTQSTKNQGNWWLILGVIILTIAPLLFIKDEYTGTDGEVQKIIQEIQPHYQPWVKAILIPSSPEIENLLFVTQGVIGAGIIGYAIGFYQGRKNK